MRDLVQKHKLDVLFLCETLVHANKIEEIHIRLGFEEAFIVSGIGRSGGLAILWRHPLKCNILSYSQNFINVVVEQQAKPRWRFTCF